MNELDDIPAAIEAVRNGEVIIVVDDEDRENEGDFLVAARHATPEVVNFMATHGRGLICAPLIEDRCDELDLELMVISIEFISTRTLRIIIMFSSNNKIVLFCYLYFFTKDFHDLDLCFKCLNHF